MGSTTSLSTRVCPRQPGKRATPGFLQIRNGAASQRHGLPGPVGMPPEPGPLGAIAGDCPVVSTCVSREPVSPGECEKSVGCT